LSHSTQYIELGKNKCSKGSSIIQGGGIGLGDTVVRSINRLASPKTHHVLIPLGHTPFLYVINLLADITYQKINLLADILGGILCHE
jgi:hypothetical protein